MYASIDLVIDKTRETNKKTKLNYKRMYGDSLRFQFIPDYEGE